MSSKPVASRRSWVKTWFSGAPGDQTRTEPDDVGQVVEDDVEAVVLREHAAGLQPPAGGSVERLDQLDQLRLVLEAKLDARRVTPHDQARARQGLERSGEVPAPGARRQVPAQPGELLAGAVAAHAHVVHDAVHVRLPVPQLLLSAPAAPDLVVGALATGERRTVRGVGLQVRRLGHALPQPAVTVVADQRGERLRGERGVQQVLQVVQVVCAEVTVGEQVGHQRDPRHAPATAVARGCWRASRAGRCTAIRCRSSRSRSCCRSPTG